MDNLERSDYIVLKDFKHNMILPISKVSVEYKMGDKLNLRINGKLTKNFIEKGYIEKITDDVTIQ